MTMSLEKRSREIVAEAQTKLAPIEYIRAAVRTMETDELVELATAYLYAQVKGRKRADVRAIEQAAPPQTKGKEPALGTKSWERWAKGKPAGVANWDAHREQLEHYEALDVSLFRELNATIGTAMDKYVETVRVQWTEELLNAEIATGDGTMTTWGDATIDQHKARMAMHKKNAMAGAEGYARHAAAIADIQAAGVTTLREAMSIAA